jgi:hypothetical protein
MDSNANTPDASECTAACYRLGRQYVVLGIVCTAGFLAMDIVSVYVSCWNVDGSFARPKLAALICGVFWSSWTLLGLWLIVAYFRERLFVTTDSITQHGCIRKRTINFPDVVHVVWKRLPQGGSVVVRIQLARIKIYLANSTRVERDQLIVCLRSAFSPDIQEDWSQFLEYRCQPRARRIPKKSRVTATICALLLFMFGGFFGVC